MAADLVTVTGTVVLADRTPASGSVSFRPAASAVDTTATSALVLNKPITVVLDETGSFSVDLTASDDAGWRTDSPVPYLVTLDVSGLACPRSWFALVTTPGPHDLWDLVDIGAAPNVVTVPGSQGPVGPPGPKGDTGPGLRVLSAVPTVDDLPTTGNMPGDAHMVTATGDLYIWGTDDAWHVTGHVQGPPGPPGSTTLDGLTDVSAPADTVAGKVLGTTAEGTWEPVNGSDLYLTVPSLTAAQPWNPTTMYTRGAMVRGADGIYQADMRQSGGQIPSATNVATWTLLATDAAYAYLAYVWLRELVWTTTHPTEWWSGRVVNIDNLVAHNGRLWISLVNNNAVEPSATATAAWADYSYHTLWSRVKASHPIWTGTQAQYDSIAVKDPNVLYVITG